ncbi:hypothetical protein U14_01851 [Candidatus Moduliflexus flocculans]|uniref:Uncharacterized protein n=1 Tax=Candidatus Moduliflexus flocculans TaxID=1499966 RepID=A0A0S6VSY4_9BACT|nr:hypothetical protein U14_01851 [Candidatus Moduliflexus flocculans]
MSFWDDLLGLAVGAAVVGGVGYALCKSMDNGIDQLIHASEEEALPAIAYAVPRMDADDWRLFAQRLEAKAQYHEYARVLFAFALCVRNAAAEIEQLLAYSLQEAFEILASVFPGKDDLEQLAFLATLHTYAEQNIKAKAIFNKLQAALSA